MNIASDNKRIHYQCIYMYPGYDYRIIGVSVDFIRLSVIAGLNFLN